MGGSHSDIAIVGAGMAGLACATKLSAVGRSVQVFDKGRGPGGRMATRRVEIPSEKGPETVRFDHGAQYFTARDAGFLAVVEKWEKMGAAARWAAASRRENDPAFVGTPGMNAPIQAMARALGTVSWNTRVEHLLRLDSGWRLATSDGDTQKASNVLVTIPAEQASDLLQEVAPKFAQIAGSVTSEPCWAVMVAFDRRLPIARDIFREPKKRISWAARDSAKPGRVGVENWVLHASPKSSRQIIDRPKEEAAEILLADFFAQTGTEPVKPIHLAAHRWLYAQPASLPAEPAYFDSKARIGIAGDYLHSPRVEGAWLSGTRLAELVLEDQP
ncbi:MAG: FAD-dependent oxidoreductase [Pseudomonadota bacterium]